MITVQSINLYQDWIDIIKSELVSKGYHFKGNDRDTISIQYFNYLKRIIPPKPRQIKKSDVFSCPNDLEKGLSFIEDKIINGQEILPHLSRKLKNLEETDDLLNDWGIFHIHLGMKLEGDGYMNRTGPLLYAIFDEINFYFLNVMPHGSWTKQEMLRTIHINWPHTIEKYRCNNIIGLAHNVTDDEIKTIRDGNFNSLIEVEPGVVYAPPGGGVVASGHSMEVRKNHNGNKAGLNDLEKKIKDDPDSFLKSIYGDDLSFMINPNLNFKLIEENEKYYTIELNNNLKIGFS